MSEYVLTSNGELYHYGVKGMKWGVRKSEYKAMSKSDKKKTRQLYKDDEKWNKRVVNKKVYIKAYNEAARRFNEQLPAINKTIKPARTESQRIKNERAYVKKFNDTLTKSLKDITNTVSPSKRYEFDMFVDTIGNMPYAALIDNNSDMVSILQFRR